VNRPWPEAVDTLLVTLSPHDSALLFLSKEKIEAAPVRLS
jgi:hypothetical protein